MDFLVYNDGSIQSWSDCNLIIIMYDDSANDYLQKYIVDKNILVIGLDCEWISHSWARYDVALIQIATSNFVILFQTCRFENEYALPQNLADIKYVCLSTGYCIK